MDMVAIMYSGMFKGNNMQKWQNQGKPITQKWVQIIFL